MSSRDPGPSWVCVSPISSGDLATLGIIDPERLKLLPAKHHDEHELCFHIHDMMVELLRGAETARASEVNVTFHNEADMNAFERLSGEDPVSALEGLGYVDEARRVVLNQVNLALFSDFLHFLYGALAALEKRKFTVALSLLRKPLKENLFFAAWACADEIDFYRALAGAPADSMVARHLQPSRRKGILGKAILRTDVPSAFSADLIYDIIYNRDLPAGLSNVLDKATHLVTSCRPLLTTESLNLNFIFKSALDDDVFEFVYFRLTYLLMFALSIQIELYSRMQQVEASFRNYCLLVALGANHALFGEGRSPVMATLTRDLREFMLCPHCHSRLKIGKRAAARFLVAERVQCRACNEESHFPLFWLLSKTNVTVADSTKVERGDEA